MDVAALQKHFRDLAGFLESAGAAKAVAADLNSVADHLAVFAAYSIKDFGSFLVRAEDYHRTGVLPVKAAGKAPAKSAPKPKVSAAETASKIKALFDMILSPDVANEEIDSTLGELDSLTKAGLREVAKALDVDKGLTTKKNDEIIRIIRDVVIGRRGTAQRSQI